LFLGAAGERQSLDKLGADGCDLTDSRHLYAIAIGSNRPNGQHGRPPAVVEAAIARLDQDFGLFDASPIVLNPAHGGAGRDFANAVALVESRLEPSEMLARLKQIERDFGRRAGRRWGPRVLDLDIALWSGGKFRKRKLQIPHPQLARRSFVLQPLAAIAPRWRVDGGLTVRHLAHRLARRAKRG
jgi:2-amino-4-hydroxy-6-hydroxymethyldihydropteridine diphosphokinase